MSLFFPLIYAPNEIFRKKAQIVRIVDDNLRHIIDKMINTLYIEGAIGIGAKMVGILQRIVVIDLQENGKKDPLILINPEITYSSSEFQKFEEASICFPGISAEISRPRKIKVSSLDYFGNNQELEAEDFLSSVIQHEMDYLEGKIFLDHLSKLKASMLLKKMQKYKKLHPPHIHGAGCRH